MSRINTSGTVMDAIIAVAEGNPGATNVIMSLGDEANVAYAVTTLDKLGIYGSSIYVLSVYCCGSNTAKMMTVLFAVDQGVWAKEKLNAAIAVRDPIDLKKELTIEQLLQLTELSR